MKLIYKGRIENFDDLPKGNLPENAVKFKEPQTATMMNVAALAVSIPVLLVIIGFVVAKAAFFGGVQKGMELFNLWGTLLALICIVPHEFLHAICFPKEATVFLYYSLSKGVAFVLSTDPVSKIRFILLSLCPMVVLGLIPLVIWLFLPQSAYANMLLSFGALGLLFGCGDLINVFNAATQMPKGSYQQLSGFHSYWFVDKEKGK